MGLVPVIKPNDWKSVQDAIRKLATLRLGPTAIPTFSSITLTDLTAARLVATDTNKKLISSDLYGWVAQASANQVIVTDDADGSITLSLPQDYDTGATPVLAGLTIVNAITEFSIDGTLAGDSDSALPTEKAVKTYVDSGAGGSLDHSLLANLDYASAAHTGFEPTVSKGNLTETTSSVLTITGGTGAVIGSGATVEVGLASPSNGDTTHLCTADQIYDFFLAGLSTRQPLDATLTSIAALGTAADKMLYTTGVDTWAETALTAFARTILDDADGATVATTIGLGTGDSVTFASLVCGNVSKPGGVTIEDGSYLIEICSNGSQPSIHAVDHDLLITAGSGGIDFGGDNLKGIGGVTGDIVATGDISCDELTLTNGDNYKFSQRDTHSLTLQNQAADQHFATEFFSANGDGDDNIFFTLWLVGTPDNVVNGEYFQMKASNDNVMKILSGAIGGGTERPIEIMTHSGIAWNDKQIYLDISGQVGIGKVPTTALDVNGDFNVTGVATIGDGGTTDFVSIDATGAMVFHGAAGLVFGGCYGNHIGWSQVNAVQNTWYNISDADMVSEPLSGVTHDENGKLTVTEPGMYLINYGCCFEDNVANDHVEIGIEVSGSGSADAAGQSHLENKFASEEEHASSSCILDLADNATIEVAIRTTDAGTPTISVQAVNLTIVQIGGT